MCMYGGRTTVQGLMAQAGLLLAWRDRQVNSPVLARKRLHETLSDLGTQRPAAYGPRIASRRNLIRFGYPNTLSTDGRSRAVVTLPDLGIPGL